jgi:chromosome segregation protein
MAFLFSIFRSRPSPFYLMDEVEPALDDVNLHRFLQLLGWFAERSQVMIVTHQKRTMEVASTMYGVSMSSDGTSRVLCQQLEDRAAATAAAEEAHARIASAAEGDPTVTVVDEGVAVTMPDPDPVR